MGIDDISFSPFDNKKVIGEIEPETKFVWLGVGAACFHLLLIALFSFLRAMPMVYFNVLSVIWYCVLVTKTSKGGSTITAIVMAFIEIIVHSILACIYVGWGMHFQMYIFALVPICAYVIDQKNDVLSGVNTIVFASAVCCIAYLLCYEASYTIEVQATFEDMMVDTVAYINFIVTFVFMGMATIFAAMDNYRRHVALIIKERELSQLTQSDILTGLYNRSSMRTYFDEMQRSGKKYYIIMADVDGLRTINDQYGREMGDLLLRNIARICVSEVSYNGYVSRWGNEEVLILKEYADMKAAYKAMENIRENIQNSEVAHDGVKAACTMSFGITAHIDGRSINESIKIAREAMDLAKQEGGNKVTVAVGEDHE